VDDAPLPSGEPRPRRSASNDTLRRHRAEVDPRPGFRVQEVGRRSPARALGPAVRQSVQLAQRYGIGRAMLKRLLPGDKTARCASVRE
jgi:hypothetical protein